MKRKIVRFTGSLLLSCLLLYRLVWADVPDEETERRVSAENIGEIRTEQSRSIWEEPRIRRSLIALHGGWAGVLVYLLLQKRGQSRKEKTERQIRKKEQTEPDPQTYQDPASGAGNRVLYEQNLGQMNPDQVYAMVMVSINHGEYTRNRYGTLVLEKILRKTVQLMKENAPVPIEVYRISEYIFCFWVEQEMNLERYTAQLKEAFRKDPDGAAECTDLAVGAVYHDRMFGETYEEMFRRCDEMRSLDQKHEEIKFMDRKLSYLNSGG